MRRIPVVFCALALSQAAVAGVDLGLGAVGGGAFYEPDYVPQDGESTGGFQAAGSPLFSVQLDPWKGKVRPVFGVTSAPTFLYSMGYDAYGVPAVVADAGVIFGSETTFATVAGHAGMFSLGAGARLTHVPWELGKAHTGIELRATWLSRWGGFAGAAWTVRFG